MNLFWMIEFESDFSTGSLRFACFQPSSTVDCFRFSGPTPFSITWIVHSEHGTIWHLRNQHFWISPFVSCSSRLFLFQNPCCYLFIESVKQSSSLLQSAWDHFMKGGPSNLPNLSYNDHFPTWPSTTSYLSPTFHSDVARFRSSSS